MPRDPCQGPRIASRFAKSRQERVTEVIDGPDEPQCSWKKPVGDPLLRRGSLLRIKRIAFLAAVGD